MATIINTPGNSPEDSSVGIIIGVLVVLVLIVVFFVFAYPNLRGTAAPANNNGTPGASTNIDVNLPSGSNGTSGGSNSGGTSY